VVCSGLLGLTSIVTPIMWHMHGKLDAENEQLATATATAHSCGPQLHNGRTLYDRILQPRPAQRIQTQGLSYIDVMCRVPTRYHLSTGCSCRFLANSPHLPSPFPKPRLGNWGCFGTDDQISATCRSAKSARMGLGVLDAFRPWAAAGMLLCGRPTSLCDTP
jgi:hypothetical protein